MASICNNVLSKYLSNYLSNDHSLLLSIVPSYYGITKTSIYPAKKEVSVVIEAFIVQKVIPTVRTGSLVTYMYMARLM